MAALAASERFDLVALSDISPAARAAASERYPALQTFGDHRQMLASTPVDVVCVATWPPSHLAVTADALALPLRGILVEKPLSDTAAGGRQVLQMIKRDIRFNTIPVIILSSSENASDIAACYSEHANAYIRKPLDLESNLQILRNIDEFWTRTVRLPKPQADKHPKPAYPHVP